MRVIKFHLSEHLVRNCDCGVEGCMVGMILPGERGRVDVKYWIELKRKDSSANLKGEGRFFRHSV